MVSLSTPYDLLMISLIYSLIPCPQLQDIATEDSVLYGVKGIIQKD